MLPGAKGLSYAGSGVGVLLCHGFTGTPQSFGTWPADVAAAGFTVEVPLLPGHGTTWQDMNRSTWKDWYATVDASFAGLRARCTTVFVAGLSMGGALALRLAIEHRDDVAGIVVVNPAVKVEDPLRHLLPVIRRLTASYPGIANDIKKPGVTELAYDRNPLHAAASLLALQADVRPRLDAVTQPLLLLRSAEDHVVPSSSSRYVLEHVGSADVTEIVLDDSYHVATLDNDAERIVKESLAFFARISGGGAP